MDEVDRNIINHMQEGFSICERPFAILAEELKLGEDELIQRVQSLLDEGTLSRFGPLYDIEMLGGVYCLVAMRIPEHDLERVIAIVNQFPEVAHNYERTHEFNMWFVLAVETTAKIESVLEEIEQQTGYVTYGMPKLEEFYVGLKFNA